MFAIVEIAGQQFKVAKDQKLFVHRLQGKEGSNVSFEKVYLLDDGKKVTVGAPAITGASVQAKVLGHIKGDKVIVFKKKRRKGYRVKNGHRQALSELLVKNIVVSGPKSTSKPSFEEVAPVKSTKCPILILFEKLIKLYKKQALLKKKIFLLNKVNIICTPN